MSMHRFNFEVPGPGPYLLSHSVGCLPRATRAHFTRQMLHPWGKMGSDGWPAWLEAIDRFRAAVAGLLGGALEEVCPQPSVSAGLTSLLSSLPRVEGRDLFLASAHAFPSVGFAMREFERFGYRLELIPEECDPGRIETWTSRIDTRVAAVVAMHVHSNSGRISPVAEIAAAARRAGTFSIVDVCQSVGIVPIDLRASGVDAAIGSCVKWLCGGPGAGFLWVRSELIGILQPLDVGWFSHAEPFEFNIRDFRYASDARRFWGGTPSIAPYVLATSGVETIANIGAAEALRHNRAIHAAFAREAEILLDLHDRGGTLCLTADDVEGLAAALAGQKCRFDRRADVVRLSPHVYNTIDEGQRTGRALRDCRVRLI